MLIKMVDSLGKSTKFNKKEFMMRMSEGSETIFSITNNR